MSGIDLTNPLVLANFVKAKIEEGKGEFKHRDNVVIYVDPSGNEYLVPSDVKLPKKLTDKKEKDDKGKAKAK